MIKIKKSYWVSKENAKKVSDRKKSLRDKTKGIDKLQITESSVINELITKMQ